MRASVGRATANTTPRFFFSSHLDSFFFPLNPGIPLRSAALESPGANSPTRMLRKISKGLKSERLIFHFFLSFFLSSFYDIARTAVFSSTFHERIERTNEGEAASRFIIAVVYTRSICARPQRIFSKRYESRFAILAMILFVSLAQRHYNILYLLKFANNKQLNLSI